MILFVKKIKITAKSRVDNLIIIANSQETRIIAYLEMSFVPKTSALQVINFPLSDCLAGPYTSVALLSAREVLLDFYPIVNYSKHLVIMNNIQSQ